MPTPQWAGFIHSWHTLAIVLKWMCITVVGIPFAIATCVVVAAAVLAFAALVLGAAAGACALVFFLFKGIYCTIFRAPVWIANAKRRRAERQLLLPLARAPAVPVQMQMQLWARGIAGTQKPVQVVPAGYMPAPGECQALPRAHVAPLTESSDSPAGPATTLPGTIECQVCLEKKWRADFPARNPTDDCEHAATDCCDMCLSQAITTAFESNVWDNIRCPTCNLQLLHKDVREFATPEIFERYDNLMTRRTLERDFPNFRWCIGPGCTFGQEHPDSPTTQPIIICSACGFISCSQHNVPWHSGQTCEEFEKVRLAGRSKEEKKTEKIIKSIAKRCPGCKRFINKNGGCNHMSCLCGRNFCWNCLHESPGHSWGCSRMH